MTFSVIAFTVQYHSCDIELHATFAVLPSVPKIVPNHLLLNDSDNVTVSCESSRGKPSASITLTVTTVNGDVRTETGSDWVSLKPSMPRTWHNATVLCNVTNHIAPNLTTEGRITVYCKSLLICYIAVP